MTDFIYRYRWFIVLFFILAGAASLSIIPSTKIDPEIRNYIPATMKSRVATDLIEKEFGVQDMVVILFSDSCILDKDDLLRIRKIDKAVSRLSGVSSRLSPFNVQSIKNEDGVMTAEPLIKEIPDDSTEIRNLKTEILRNRFARDVVFSSDFTTASVSATINNLVPERVTLAKIDSIVLANPGKAHILKGGLPYIRFNILKDVSRDAIILVPMALLLMLIILKVNLGRWRSVAMPFSVVFFSTAFSIALIPVLGWKMSIITLLLPVLLIAVANNYGIYLVARYQEIRLQRPDASKREIMFVLFRSLNKPILFSGITTIAGILGLMAHSVIPARQLGILAATGVTFALIMSLLYIPALIFISKERTYRREYKRDHTALFDRVLSGLSGLIIRHPGKILVFSLITVLLVSSGIFFLKINTNQEKFFSRNHPVRQASRIINSKFGGSQTISVMISGDIKSPEVMKGIDKLTMKIEKTGGVGNVFSISQVVKEMSKAIFSPGEAGYDRIPDTKEAIAQMFELYNMSGSPEDFKQIMNLEDTKAQVLIRLSDPGNKVVSAVRSEVVELTKDIPARITLGGYALIMTDFSQSIIKGQIGSLLFALVTVFILLAIIFKSVKGGLIGSIPLFASIPVLFGFMGFSGIALDAATALLSSIMIGVGVDFTIQYIWNFNLQIRSGLDYKEATSAALRTIGRSIIINAVSVMGGFSALVFSGFTSIRFFGYLVLISIGSCLIGAIVVIPAYLVKFMPGFIGFDVVNKKRRINEKERDVIGITTAAFAGRAAAS